MNDAENKGPFPKIREFLKTKAPALLEKAGAFLPSSGYLGILKNLISIAGPTQISDADKAQALLIVQQEFETFTKELEDVASARQMQIAALQQEDKFAKRFIYYLATFMILSATGFGI